MNVNNMNSKRIIMVQLEIDNSCKEEKKEEINEEYTKGAKKVKKNKVIIIFLL